MGSGECKIKKPLYNEVEEGGPRDLVQGDTWYHSRSTLKTDSWAHAYRLIELAHHCHPLNTVQGTKMYNQKWHPQLIHGELLWPLLAKCQPVLPIDSQASSDVKTFRTYQSIKLCTSQSVLRPSADNPLPLMRDSWDVSRWVRESGALQGNGSQAFINPQWMGMPRSTDEENQDKSQSFRSEDM